MSLVTEFLDVLRRGLPKQGQFRRSWLVFVHLIAVKLMQVYNSKSPFVSHDGKSVDSNGFITKIRTRMIPLIRAWFPFLRIGGRRFVYALLGVLASSGAAYAQSPNLEFSKLWFKPSLIENNHPKCGEILADAQRRFLTTESVSYGYNPSKKSQASVAGLTPFFFKYGSSPTFLLSGKEYKFRWYTHPGCGGACETYQMLVEPVSGTVDLKDLISASPPAASGIQLYKGDQEDYWLTTVNGEGDLLFYRLTQTGNWAKACAIELKPKNVHASAGVDAMVVLDSLSELKSAVGELMRGAGSCGTMGTHGRWFGEFSEILPQVLYRPWAMKDEDDSYGRYGRDLDGLRDWSRIGISEQRSFNNYLIQIKMTEDVVSDYFVKKYGWNQDQARSIAHTALTGAVSGTIRFYYFEPFESEEERKYRDAIISDKPIAELEKIKFDPVLSEQRRRDSHSYGGSYRYESILNIAINSPVLTKYLLDKGIDPNFPNEFGKTPLMYAAQYNRLESARYLLDAGANPNSVTIKPSDDCFYTLQTSNMTALHYAVRYASPELIRLLLDNGAATFVEAKGTSAHVGTPLRWLKEYTSKDSPERNQNIPDNAVTKVEAWLQEETPEELEKMAVDYILDAERLYQKEDIRTAFNKLSLALLVQPENKRALSDMSLIAYKYGRFKEAIEAANKLIKISSNNKEKANAYHNLALACRVASYPAKSQCGGSALDQLLKAYELDPVSSRRQRVVDQFSDDKYSLACVSPESINGIRGIVATYPLLYLLTDRDFDYEKIMNVVSWRSRTGERPESVGGRLSQHSMIDMGNGIFLHRYRTMGALENSVVVDGVGCSRFSKKVYKKMDAKVVLLYSSAGEVSVVNDSTKNLELILSGGATWKLYGGEGRNVVTHYLKGDISPAIRILEESESKTIYKMVAELLGGTVDAAVDLSGEKEFTLSDGLFDAVKWLVVNDEGGIAGLDIMQPGRYNLILDSYRKSFWHLELAKGVEIDTIYVTPQSTINGGYTPKGVTVESIKHPRFEHCDEKHPATNFKRYYGVTPYACSKPIEYYGQGIFDVHDLKAN